VTGDGTGDGFTTFDAYTVARQLERVGDHAEKIGRVAERIDGDPPARSRATSTTSRSTRARSSGTPSPRRSPSAIPTRCVRYSRTARRSSRPRP